MTWNDGLTPIPTGAPLELWLLHLSQELDGQPLSWISAEERHRAAQFRFSRDRHRYLLAHVAVRWLVSQRAKRPPASLLFSKSPLGKPGVANAPELRFSLSYARHVALIGIGRGLDVGVDIEQQQTVPDAYELAEALFTPAEFTAIQSASSDQERSLLFLTGWTRKEACLKAAGTGLRRPTATIETSLDTAPATVRLSPSNHVEVASFPVEGHIASWARQL
jgi:4'-phosphopantetheinyl transferase